MHRSALAFCCLAVLSARLWAGEVQVINDDAEFPEGPFWADGRLYYAEYGGNRVSVWDGTANRVLWQEDGCGPSAVMPFAGGMLVTCYDNGTIVDIGADGQTQRVWDKDATGAALIGPNDATPDARGGAYVTASGPWESGPIIGKIYHLAAAGALTPVADDLHYANGIQLSADGKLLYVNESEAGRVITFAGQDDGSLADRRLFVRLTALEEPVDAYPDGIKLGPDGNLYIGQYSAGRIVVLTTDGKLVRKLEVPSPAAPNLAFSSDGRTLYVMAVDDRQNPPTRARSTPSPIRRVVRYLARPPGASSSAPWRTRPSRSCRRTGGGAAAKDPTRRYRTDLLKPAALVSCEFGGQQRWTSVCCRLASGWMRSDAIKASGRRREVRAPVADREARW